MTTHAPASEIAINPKTEKCKRLEAALLVAKAEIAQRDEIINSIDSRLGKGWTKELAKALSQQTKQEGE